MVSSGTSGHSSGTLPPMQYPSSTMETSSGATMNMYALHEANESTGYDEHKSGAYRA